MKNEMDLDVARKNIDEITARLSDDADCTEAFEHLLLIEILENLRLIRHGIDSIVERGNDEN